LNLSYLTNNQRPAHYECATLSTEPHQRVFLLI